MALHWILPKPSIFPPGPRKGAQKVGPTPEQIATIVPAKLKSPGGHARQGRAPLKMDLRNAVVEWLMVRVSRGYPSLAAQVQAVLEREGKGSRSGLGQELEWR